MIDMRHAIIKLCELATVPAIRRSHEIARDALQLINIL